MEKLKSEASLQGGIEKRKAAKNLPLETCGWTCVCHLLFWCVVLTVVRFSSCRKALSFTPLLKMYHWGEHERNVQLFRLFLEVDFDDKAAEARWPASMLWQNSSGLNLARSSVPQKLTYFSNWAWNKLCSIMLSKSMLIQQRKTRLAPIKRQYTCLAKK